VGPPESFCLRGPGSRLTSKPSDGDPGHRGDDDDTDEKCQHATGEPLSCPHRGECADGARCPNDYDSAFARLPGLAGRDFESNREEIARFFSGTVTPRERPYSAS
jgi:hypothetical protein